MAKGTLLNVTFSAIFLHLNLPPPKKRYITVDTFKEALEMQGALMTVSDFAELFEEHLIAGTSKHMFVTC